MKCEDVYRIFFKPGEVTEIRAYGLSKQSVAWEGWAGGSGVVYGYFDNAKAFGKAAQALEKARSPGIYFTLNPTIPDLLARAANRLKASGSKPVQTSDRDILCIRWIPLDFDPVLPAGISSTEKELKAAQKMRNDVARWLKKEMNAADGIPAVSGNGAHYLLRAPDMPNTDETKEKVKAILQGLAAQFPAADVKIDEMVFNASRIWKLYGTTARKGDHTENRPHRRSFIADKFLRG